MKAKPQKTIPPSPVQLRSSHFKEIEVNALEEGSLENPFSLTPRVETAPSVDHDRIWRIDLTVTIQSDPENPFAYNGKVRAIGIIEIHPDIDASQVAPFARVNGVTLLYGIIRELVHTLTARSEHGEWILPTLDFRDLATGE
ncbi:MAG: protein-export chaperone SecB [Opitutales bacterium]|nr:protein-export chaperone SecB [Opitutales bacterium]